MLATAIQFVTSSRISPTTVSSMRQLSDKGVNARGLQPAIKKLHVCIQNPVYASRISCMRPESRVCVQNLVHRQKSVCRQQRRILNFQIKASMQSAFNSMSNNVRNNSATKNSMVNRRHVQQCNASSPTRHVVKNIVKKKTSCMRQLSDNGVNASERGSISVR